MRLGYNTNGLAHHRWEDAIAMIAETGYRSVALTVDHHCLPPWSSTLPGDVQEVREALRRYDLHCVIETGARFILDPHRKHSPTLLSSTPEEREHRQRFLQYCVDLAAALNADAVSFWSGTDHEKTPPEVLWLRLIEECCRLAEYAKPQGVRLAFEPEPGMFIQTGDEFQRLLDAVNHPLFGLTLDVGHVHCLQDGAIADHIYRWPDRLWNIHIEDMRPGVHEHLPFGEGTIDFPPIFAALRDIGYAGGVHVELARHSHEAPVQLHRSFEFLHRFID
jgi:L-ribulose-5-phosphate 3-epimerase